eukprot:CAMPEP_0204025776 /NCGR_PEP_ID=MMETSP0360-20130528/42923_1 /ASSEMBLY_ACC=CAM_ASM_000342 /TAXON_ID=268821 /ORGANISM="Scrippsiella Hangoei, Strain SHTV-5" /LENGTH=42 /DNA_ID= /DNA_START= /DNA_END= /DNA_ORIENTATION=
MHATILCLTSVHFSGGLIAQQKRLKVAAGARGPSLWMGGVEA